jgi:hypothetical protein
MIEMNVRNDGECAAGLDRPKSSSRVHIGNPDPNDLAARDRESPDLAYGAIHVASVRIGHGLNRDRRAIADWHPANVNSSCPSSFSKHESSLGAMKLPGTRSLGSVLPATDQTNKAQRHKKIKDEIKPLRGFTFFVRQRSKCSADQSPDATEGRIDETRKQRSSARDMMPRNVSGNARVHRAITRKLGRQEIPESSAEKSQ